MNSITVIGRIANDLKLTVSRNGNDVLKFRVASDKRKADADGTKANFFNVVAFGKQATFLHEYASKGRLVSVIGEMDISQYSKDGHDKTWYEIVANQVKILDRVQNGKNSAQNSSEHDTIEGEGYDPFADE